MVTIKKAEFTHEVAVSTRLQRVRQEYRRLLEHFSNGTWEVNTGWGWEQTSDIVSALLDHAIEGK